MMHKMERHEVESLVRAHVRQVAALVDKELAKRDAKIEALEKQVAKLHERLDQLKDGGW